MYKWSKRVDRKQKVFNSLTLMLVVFFHDIIEMSVPQYSMSEQHHYMPIVHEADKELFEGAMRCFYGSTKLHNVQQTLSAFMKNW